MGSSSPLGNGQRRRSPRRAVVGPLLMEWRRSSCPPSGKIPRAEQAPLVPDGAREHRGRQPRHSRLDLVAAIERPDPGAMAPGRSRQVAGAPAMGGAPLWNCLRAAEASSTGIRRSEPGGQGTPACLQEGGGHQPLLVAVDSTAALAWHGSQNLLRRFAIGF